MQVKKDTVNYSEIIKNDSDFPGGSDYKESAIRETWAWSLGCKDSLEVDMASHSSILPGEFPWTEEPGWLQSMGSQRVRHDWIQNSTAQQEWPTDSRSNQGFNEQMS